MAILNEVRKYAKAMGVDTDSQDITTIITKMTAANGGTPKAHNIEEATAELNAANAANAESEEENGDQEAS